MASLTGQIADAVVAAIIANKATILPLIVQGEAGVEGLIEKALDNVKFNGPLLPIVWSAVKPAIVAQLAALDNAYPSEVVWAFLVQEAQYAAKQLGG